jgi:hypothetical protein
MTRLKALLNALSDAYPKRACKISNGRILLSQRALGKTHTPFRQVCKRRDPGGLLEAHRERRPRHRWSISQCKTVARGDVAQTWINAGRTSANNPPLTGLSRKKPPI